MTIKLRLARSLMMLCAVGGILNACISPPPSSSPAFPAICRVGPDGGPLLDRVVDRGIGGTGAPVLSDRGIGGTGIIAVITGFASICLAGQEVALPSQTPVIIGEATATQTALRVGQLAVVDAVGREENLVARRVTVLYAVSGPVDEVSANGLLVAGQRVAIMPDTSGGRPSVGDWVSISGLRRLGDVIEATRVDDRGPGPATVSGTLLEQDGVLRIGALPIAPNPLLEMKVGANVTVTGPVLFGQMQPAAVASNLLATDPTALFSSDTRHFLLEGFRATATGRPASDLTRANVGSDARRTLLRLDRPGGNPRGVESNSPSASGMPPRGPFAAAPVPDRTLSGPARAPGGIGQAPSGANAEAGRLGLAPPRGDAFGPAVPGARPPGGPGGPGGGPGAPGGGMGRH